MGRWVGGSRAVGRAVVVLAAASHLAAAASAQAPPELVTLRGRVVDGARLAPLAQARVIPADPARATLTDDAGYFELRLPPAERWALTFEHLGYRTERAVVPDGARRVVNTYWLEPDPVALGGIEVSVAMAGLAEVEAAMADRRDTWGGAVTRVPPERLVREGVRSAFLVLRGYLAGLHTCQPEPGRADWCVRRRGREIPVTICIDDQRAWGGAEQMRAHTAADLHSVDIFDRGRLVLVYTRPYMARAMSTVGRRVEPDPDRVC